MKTLRAGGVAYFQVPTHSQGYTFNVHEYLKSDLEMNMEVHVLPQRYIFDIITANACDVLEVQADNMLGSPEEISNTFLCRKKTTVSTNPVAIAAIVLAWQYSSLAIGMLQSSERLRGRNSCIE